MAYSSTQDEQYIFGIKRSPRTFDAPANINDQFVLGEGQKAYGTLVYQNFSKDIDVYSLGQLSTGTYSVTVEDETWDYFNYDAASISSFYLLNSFGGIEETKYFNSYGVDIEFTVQTPSTYYMQLDGGFFGSAQSFNL